MTEFRIETDSPLVDLRPGASFNERAATWLGAAQLLLDEEIASRRRTHGGEEVELLFSNRQVDHLAMGLGRLATHFRNAA